MADVELVIRIPESLYNFVRSKTSAGNSRNYDDYDMYDVSRRIANGIPLPKGHGRLGDLDALESEMINGIKAGNYEEGYENYSHILNVDDCVECVRYAETILEADKEGD